MNTPIIPRPNGQPEERAASLLIHYFELSGIKLNSDHRQEIADIIECTIKAAVEEAERKASRSTDKKVST